MNELRYKAIQDLLHKETGEICFIKDKIYIDLSFGVIKGGAAFKDELGMLHGVCNSNTPEHKGWLNYFILENC